MRKWLAETWTWAWRCAVDLILINGIALACVTWLYPERAFHEVLPLVAIGFLVSGQVTLRGRIPKIEECPE